MLTREQKLILALRVNENKETIFAKYGPGVTKKKKEEAWEAIRKELVIMGATLPDIRAVRDIEWYNLRRSSIKKFMDFQSNGIPKENLPDINGIVIDAIGLEEAGDLDPNSSTSAQSDMGHQSPSPELDHQSNHFGAMNGFEPEYDAQVFAPPPELMNTLADTSKLQKKLLQLDIELKRHQIRETKARLAYYQAATKLLNDKKLKSQTKPVSNFNSDTIVVDPSELHQ